jgi:hypothetical protein
VRNRVAVRGVAQLINIEFHLDLAGSKKPAGNRDVGLSLVINLSGNLRGNGKGRIVAMVYDQADDMVQRENYEIDEDSEEQQ